MCRSSEVRAFYTLNHRGAPGIPRFEFSGVTKLRKRDWSLDGQVSVYGPLASLEVFV